MSRQIALDSAGKDLHRLLWRDTNTDFNKQFRMTWLPMELLPRHFTQLEVW